MFKPMKVIAIVTFVAMSAGLMTSDNVWADDARTTAVTECRVTIGAVLVYRDGSVNVLHSGRGDYTYICNLSSERLGVSPTTCAMWTRMLQSLKLVGKRADFYYQLEPTFTSCADLPTYSASPAPVYIGTME
jgi:hypothetical protein